MKNTLYYLFILLLDIPLRIISLVIYPIVFLLRWNVLKWATEHFYEDGNRMFVMCKGYKKWKVYFHPYFWLWCFTTGLTIEFCGPEWFMREQKLDLNGLRYFWICYRWQALRNSHWAWSEWFYREGKWKEGSEEMPYCRPMGRPMKGYIYKYWDIMPQLKWDEGNDGGKVLRFPPNEVLTSDIWLYTHTGKKRITFTTFKGNRRFMYAFCKVIYWKHYQLIIERQFGWNWWNGIPILHFKHILRKI